MAMPETNGRQDKIEHKDESRRRPTWLRVCPRGMNEVRHNRQSSIFRCPAISVVIHVVLRKLWKRKSINSPRQWQTRIAPV